MTNVSSESAVRKTSSWRPWLTFMVFLLGTCAGYGTARLYDFASLHHFDSSALPRERHNAPYISTPQAIVDKMIEVGEITADDVVYDLGCGDGRIVITAAVQRGCRGVGIDYDPQRVLEANENVRKQKVEQLVTIEQQDVFEVDLTKATVIVVYLLPGMLADLKPNFDRCAPGTRIVSHDFEIEGVIADKIVKIPVEKGDEHYVRLYVTPLRMK